MPEAFRPIDGLASRPSPGRQRAAVIALATSYLGAAVTIGKGVLLVPLFLKMFGLDVYGAFLASANVVGLLGIMDLGISSVLTQTLAEAWGSRDYLRFERSSGAGLVAVFALVGVMLLAALFVAPLVPELVKAPSYARKALSLTFLLTAVGTALGLATTNLVAISAAWQRTEIGGAARVISQTVDIVVIVAGLYEGLGVVALGFGAITGAGVGFTVAVIWTVVCWRRLRLARPRVSRADILELLRMTLPMMLSRIMLQVGSNLEVALVSALVSPAAAAIYALTDRIMRVALNFVNPIAGSVLSGLAHYVGELGARAAAKPARDLLSLWSLVVAASLPPMLVLNEDFTTLWVGRANFGGFALNAALCAAAILGSRDYIMSAILTSAGGIRTVAWSNIVEVAVRIPAMYPALLALGAVGIPACSAGVSSAFIVVFGRYIHKRLALSRDEARALNFAGSLSITASFLLGLLGAPALPHATTWGGLAAKGLLVGALHLGVALLANPEGRTIAMRQIGHRRSR